MPRRPIAYTLLLWYLAACTSWRVQELTPQQVIDRWHPASVRITTADSSEFVLDKPWIPVRDSLLGFRNGVPASVAVSDITAVALWQPDSGKTIGLIAGLSLVLILAAAAAGGINIGPSGPIVIH
jgi:hypothetical protein